VEAPLPANAASVTDASVQSVSCSSVGNCTAGGIYVDSSGGSQGLLLTEKSGRWAAGAEASLPADATTVTDVGVLSVSCALAGDCRAVGY
jgi:hypothetical protein